MQSQPESEWSYSNANPGSYTSSVPRSTTDPGQYALAGGNTLPSSNGTTYSGQIPSRVPSFDAPGLPYAGAVPRQSFPLQFSSNLDVVPSQYTQQRAGHGMPYLTSQGTTTNYSSLEYPQHWTSLSPNTRSLPGGYTFDPDLPSTYHSSSTPFMPSSGLTYPSGMTESGSIFPGLSPLASHLPYSGPSRNLPNPAGFQTPYNGSIGSVPEHDVGLDTYPQNLTSRSSISSATRDAINASEASSSTASSSPSEMQRSLGTGFSGLPYSSHGDSNASTTNLASSSILRRESNGENYMTSNAGTQSSQAGNSQLPILNSSYGLTSMPGGFGTGNNSVIPVSPGRSTVPGQLRPSLHHPQPQHSASQDMPPILKSNFDSNSSEPGRSSKSKIKGQKIHGKR